MEVFILALQSKEEQITENMNAIPKIDTSVEINIPRSSIAFDDKKHKFKCVCCGKGFTSQSGNFQKTNDVLFQSNGGYLPWCKECTDLYVTQMTSLMSNNEELAIKDFCQRAGWVYETNPLKASREVYSGHRDRTRISHYGAKRNLNVGGRKTFIDSIKYNFEKKQDEIVMSKEDVKTKEVSVTGTAIDRWGVGLTEWDYNTLEDHYKMLKRNNPNADNNAEIFIKSLCNLNWVTQKMLRNENLDATKYTSLIEQYNKTFTKAGLRTVEEKDGSSSETLGVTLAEISQYTPEEYYKDKKKYKDFDGLGDYINRFITRPLKNLQHGTTDRDIEFCVKDGDEDE